MPKIFTLEEPSREKKEELIEKLRQYPELKPRVTVTWPLSKERETALEMIKSERIEEKAIINLLKSADFIENRAGLYILSQTPNIPKGLEKKAIPFLKEFILESQDGEIKERAFKALSWMPGSLSFLTELIEAEKYSRWRAKTTDNQNLAIKTIANIPEGQSFLKNLTKSKDWWVKKEAEQALEEISPRKEAAQEKQKEMPEKGYPWLLATRKPLFATPFTQELATRILELDKIEKKLREKNGDKLVGIVVYGSTAKGYLKSASDLDYTVISEDPQVVKQFKKLAESLDLCPVHDHWVGPEEGKISGYVNALFTGIFFGQRKKLLEYQKKYLTQIDEDGWHKIRRIIMIAESSILRAQRVLGLKEREKIEEAIALLRTPPPRKKALEIINQRLSAK